MGQRNMQYSSNMIGVEADQQVQDYIRPEPCVFYGGMTNFPQANAHAIIQAPANVGNFNLHHLPDHHDNAVFYGMAPYSGVQHQPAAANLELAIAASGHYNPYMAPPSATRDFPVPVNHGAHDHLPFLSTHRVIGIPTDNFGRNNVYMDGVRGSFKRKNFEGVPGGFQYRDGAVGSSSSVGPMNSRQLDSDLNIMDAPSFVPPEYGGSDAPSFIENGPQRSVRNRSGIIGQDAGLAHNANHLVQGNYIGQAFPFSATPWVDPQFGTNGGDVDTFAWNQAVALPYLHGGVGGGCVEAGSIAVQGYQMTAGNGTSPGFLHAPIPQGHPTMHHPPVPIQGLRGHNVNFPLQIGSSSRRIQSNSASNTGINPFQGVVESGSRYLGPVPPAGFRLYRPNRREVAVETNPRHRNIPHLRVLPEDGVAVLDISDYHEIGDSNDQHRDMRLDIDHMSYEELLALGEQIGSVGTGLSEEVIMSNLKRRTFELQTSMTNEGIPHSDHKVDFCVVCQTDYEDQEDIGLLDCGHEYHVECIKKWLIMKNTCPICKSTALKMERANS